jgi:SAM-dependent methyltransferase
MNESPAGAAPLMEDSPVPATAELREALAKVEYYQPLYGISGLDPSRRNCRDRALAIAEAIGFLGKNFRLIDFGCSLGYFPFFFADRGAATAGIDHYPDHIAVARATQRLNGLKADFQIGSLDAAAVQAIAPGQFDVALILSVLHHITHHNGLAYTAQMVADLFNRVSVLVLELAHRYEDVGYPWRLSQPEDPLAVLGACGRVKVRVLGQYASHLSSSMRPMILVTR